MLESHHKLQLDTARRLTDNLRDICQLSEPILESRNLSRILNALKYDGMDSRRDEVGEAAPDTFRWLIKEDKIPPGHDAATMSFRKWLSSGQGVWHIMGKPGSGKSTLMRLAESDREARSQLEKWAGDQTLVFSTFYAWKAGNKIQRGFDGLLRTIIHSVLTQVPELSATTFPKHWQPSQMAPWLGMTLTKELPIHSTELAPALERILRSSDLAQGYRFFFLIDGLDEFDNISPPRMHSDLVRMIQSWTLVNPNRIKVCVSSREENPFLNSFSAEQKLRLHLVTKGDVHALLVERFKSHPQLECAPQDVVERLISTIAGRAEGVFLWVVLCISELWHQLDNLPHDRKVSWVDLQESVERLPTGLAEFFDTILGSIHPSYIDEGKAVLSLVSVLTWINEVDHGLLCIFLKQSLKSLSSGIQVDLEHWTLQDVQRHQQEFVARLPNLCKGLLIMVQKPGGWGPTRTWTPSTGNPARFEFIHRSVYDYLTEHRVTSRFISGYEDMQQVSGVELFFACSFNALRLISWEFWLWEQGQITPLIDRLVLLATDTANPSKYFSWLQMVEETFFQKQKVFQPGQTFASAGIDEMDLSRLQFSVIIIACLSRLRRSSRFFGWALDNYPPWIWDERFRVWTLDLLWKRRFTKPPSSVLDSATLASIVQRGWVSLNNPIATCEGSFALVKSLPIPKSTLWVNLLYNLLNNPNGTTLRHWRDVKDFLNFGADPFVCFIWKRYV